MVPSERKKKGKKGKWALKKIVTTDDFKVPS